MRSLMPRYRTQPAEGPGSQTVEFDLCSRCAENGDIVRTVVSGKLGLAVGPESRLPVDPVPHRSYDFQPRPTPCISCARVLSSEDD